MFAGDADYWDVDGETDEPLQAVSLPVRDFLSTEPIERNGGNLANVQSRAAEKCAFRDTGVLVWPV